jgi:adenylate cyclase class IV
MARNVEIKARLADARALHERLVALTGQSGQELLQDDTFFACARGRLKLRQFADGSAELIHYQRADDPAARLSDYVRCSVADAAALREALARALGIGGRVCKRRLLWLIGPTRVHVDAVEGLGDFVELEVVLQPGQTVEEGAAVAETLLAELGLAGAPRLAAAYVDLHGAVPAPGRGTG